MTEGNAPTELKDCRFNENNQNHLPWEDKGSQKGSDSSECYPDKVDLKYLSLKTKELTILPPDYEVNVECCVVCGIWQWPDWLVTQFDGRTIYK